MFITPYLKLIRIDRPIGILLLLWPTMWALLMASKGKPSLKLLIIFSLGVFLMRSAGCIINDIADRSFDGHVKRTKSRPLAAGKISLKQAIILFGILCLLSASLLFFLNAYCFYLAWFALVFTILYPFTKRFFVFPQSILGLTFSWGILFAFAAVQNHLPLESFILYLLAFLWITLFDTFYGMTDKDDDIKIGIHSSALFLGNYDKLFSFISMVVITTLWIVLAVQLKLAWPFYISLIIATGLFVYQYQLIKTRKPKNTFKAFLNNNWYGFILLVGLCFNYL